MQKTPVQYLRVALVSSLVLYKTVWYSQNRQKSVSSKLEWASKLFRSTYKTVLSFHLCVFCLPKHTSAHVGNIFCCIKHVLGLFNAISLSPSCLWRWCYTMCISVSCVYDISGVVTYERDLRTQPWCPCSYLECVFECTCVHHAKH